MAGIENRHIVLFRKCINRREKTCEILLCVDVLFSVCGKEDILIRLQTKAVKNIALLDFIKIHA